MKKRVVIWSSFMVIMLFGVFTMYVKAQTTTTYYLNNRNELFQGAPANSNCGEIAACIKTTTGITGSNISYNASKDQVTVNGLNAKELRIYASKFYLTGNESKLDACTKLLEKFTILELARTGITGLSRGSENSLS